MPAIDGELRFCSVGRYTSAKNFDNVPFICRMLVEKGLKFKWYIIGYGGDEALIKRNIQQAGMEQVCILLGKKSNPYPYMKACDIYIQPSRFEGKAVTVREAQILGKPVVITRFATSSAQLTEQVDGIIVPMDNEGAAEGIYAYAQNPTLQQQIISYLQSHDYGNESEIKKLEFHPSQPSPFTPHG
jgi:glycosyltransferase involved in cell wall biosynthesis